MGMELQQSLQIPGTPRSYYEEQPSYWTPPVPPPPWMGKESAPNWQQLTDVGHRMERAVEPHAGEFMSAGEQLQDLGRNQTTMDCVQTGETSVTPTGNIRGKVVMY